MQFKSIKINQDGSVTGEIANGRSITTDGKGKSRLDIHNLRTAGIKQLAHVQSYTINTVMGSISHHVRFHGGGKVTFAYSEITGKLLELSAENTQIEISDKGEVLFSRFSENEA